MKPNSGMANDPDVSSDLRTLVGEVAAERRVAKKAHEVELKYLELRALAAEAEVRRLKADSYRLDYLESEEQLEQKWGGFWNPMSPSLFRCNRTITRGAIDSAMNQRDIKEKNTP